MCAGWSVSALPTNCPPYDVPLPLNRRFRRLLAAGQHAPSSMRQQSIFALLLASQLSGAAKYGCIFDCYLSDAQGSAQGYLEYSCNSPETEAGCCAWQRCIAEANTLYRGQICPASDVGLTSDGVAAKYAVGVSETRAADFPRNAFPLSSSEAYGSCDAYSSGHTVGCTGNCGTHSHRVSISLASQ